MFPDVFDKRIPYCCQRQIYVPCTNNSVKNACRRPAASRRGRHASWSAQTRRGNCEA